MATSPADEARFASIERRLAAVETAVRPPITTTTTSGYPADIVGKGWKLTIGAEEIKQPRLATFSHAKCQVVGNGVRMRVNHGDRTTKNSRNPRTEWREMDAIGVREAAWSTARGKHTLSVSLSVDRLTALHSHLVIAQIHGADDDVTVWRVESDKLWITAGDDTNAYLVDDNFRLGALISVGFEVADSYVLYRYNGQIVDHALKARDLASYFKVGAYLQSNSETAPGESPSEFAEVTIRRPVTVIHT